MLISRTVIALAAVAACVGASGVALADETGFASMHTLRKEGGRLCMVDHFHSGTGAGRTKDAAKRAAINSWSSFTAFEYGSNWARFGRAANASAQYTKTETGWSATIDARPCR
ncbi:MAG: hypothetical protein ACRCS9_05140 [Hyphomicrobium sp.]